MNTLGDNETPTDSEVHAYTKQHAELVANRKEPEILACVRY